MNGRSSRRKAGNFWKLRSKSARSSAVTCAATRDWTKKSATSLAFLRASSVKTVSAFSVSCPASCSGRRGSSGTRRTPQRRVRALRTISWMSSARAPPGPVPSSFRRIENRSRNGRRWMLLIRSASTGVVGVLDRQQPLAGAGLAVGDLLELRRRGRSPRSRGSVGRALDQLLADHRLEADRAVRVLAEVLEAGLFDPHDDRGLVGRRSGPRARRGPRPRRPSRPRPSRPGPGSGTRRCRRSPGPCSRRLPRRSRPRRSSSAAGTASTSAGYRERAPHGPGGLVAGSQSSALEPAVVGERAGAVLRRLGRAARAAAVVAAVR